MFSVPSVVRFLISFIKKIKKAGRVAPSGLDLSVSETDYCAGAVAGAAEAVAVSVESIEEKMMLGIRVFLANAM